MSQDVPYAMKVFSITDVVHDVATVLSEPPFNVTLNAMHTGRAVLDVIADNWSFIEEDEPSVGDWNSLFGEWAREIYAVTGELQEATTLPVLIATFTEKATLLDHLKYVARTLKSLNVDGSDLVYKVVDGHAYVAYPVPSNGDP